MSKKIGFLQRWMFIIDKINSHPYISKDELEKAIASELVAYDGVENIGFKSRTIERDIREIRNSPLIDISIEYSRHKRGYYIPQNEKSLSKLERFFELSSLLAFNALHDIVFVEKKETKGIEYRFDLIGAIRDSYEVVIDYKKFQTGAVVEVKRLQPYALIEHRNRWYLIATNVKRANENPSLVKTYGLDRIEKLTLTNQHFKKDPHINIREKFRFCFGIFSNEELKPQRIILSFTPVSGRYAASCPIHETQQTLIDNEEEFRIELTVKITPDLISELLARSEGMRVIEPKSLKEELIEAHRRAIKLLEL